jgi:predicted  nucleic acid-binding Zn-ribbon protein
MKIILLTALIAASSLLAFAPAAGPGRGAALAVSSEAPDQDALEQAREHFGKLSARASAIRESLRTLEEEQKKQGLGLRGDISASWKRMEYHLDEADSALKREDVAAGKRNMKQAEREADKLEEFLGR